MQQSFAYDDFGRKANGDTLAYQFDAGGRLIQRSMPNGVSARFAYNEDNSLRQVVNRDTASHILSQHDYAYDGVGQRASLAEAFNDASLGETASLAQAYTYDELKRLTAVSASGALSRNWTYGYDPLGNRTLMGVSSGNDSQSVTLQYDAANQLSKYTDGSGQVTPAPTYDANGNLTYDGLRTYTWDALDQLIQVSGGGSSAPISYSYDDSGRRIAKATAGTQTLWTYDGQDIYAEYTDTWTTPSAVYTSGGATDDPVIKATITATGTGPSRYGPALYYHADGLGTVVGLSNNQDSSTQLTVLDAWGVSLGGPPTPMAQYGYTGREPDETGLVYMRARYYSPQFGRFVSRDPAGLQGGINAYAYCGNNPTNCTDPSGLMPQSALSSFVDSSYFGMGTQGAGLSPSIGPSPGNYPYPGGRLNPLNDPTVQMVGGALAADAAYVTGLVTGNQALQNIAIEGMRQSVPSNEGISFAIGLGLGGRTGAGEAAFFRGTRTGESPSFAPRPNDFRVDSQTGFVKDTHGVSVFDNPLSVSSKGFTPHQVDPLSIPDSLRIIQRGSDPNHYEITPKPGANLTPQQFINACGSISCIK